MKRVNNIYKKIYDIDNILEYAHIVCLNTTNKNKVERFNQYISENIFYIRELLISKKYTPGKYNIFLIKEPKLRIIMSQNIVDKIINHLCAKYFLIDVFDKKLIDSNIATRKGKGTHYGIKLLKKYLKEISKINRKFYVLKFDIKKYFYNIDHEIVKDILRVNIKDKNALDILVKIIDSTDEEYVNECIKKIKFNEINRVKNKNIKLNEKEIQIRELEDLPEYKVGKCFPIGNMSSQIFAIVYLNELDHYIKEKLKIKYYIRYMDDGVIIHEDKEYLKKCLQEIVEILKKYKLEVNVKKTKIDGLNNGIDFLGFRFYLKNCKIVLKLRNNTKKRFKKRSKELIKMKKDKMIDKKEFDNLLASYKGHLMWGSCGSLFYNNIRR